MIMSQALMLASVISIAISLLVIAVMLSPVRTVTEIRCAGPEAAAFWARFTVLMLILVPFVLVLLFAVPPGLAGAADSPAALVWRTLTAAFLGHVVVLAIVALNFGRGGPGRPEPTRRSQHDGEFWGAARTEP
jgi:hypothetical protein